MDHSDPSDSTKKRMSKFGLACLKCRSRKIKCDSRKPVCENCEKKGFECVFDETPKTRGPDKNPGRKRRTAAQMHAEAKLLRGQGPSESYKKPSHKAVSTSSSAVKHQPYGHQFTYSAEFPPQHQIPAFLPPQLDESSSEGRRSTSSNDMLSASSSSGLTIDSSHILSSDPSHPPHHIAHRRSDPLFESGFPLLPTDATGGPGDLSLASKPHHHHQQHSHHPHYHQQQNHYIHPSAAMASSYAHGAPNSSLPPPQMFPHPSGAFYPSHEPPANSRLSYPGQPNSEAPQLAEPHSPTRQPSQATSIHLALVSPVPGQDSQNLVPSQSIPYQIGYNNSRAQYQRYQQQNDPQQMHIPSTDPSHPGHVYQYPSSAPPPPGGDSQASSAYQYYNQQRAYQQARQPMYQGLNVSSSFPPYYQSKLASSSTTSPSYEQSQQVEYHPQSHHQQQPDFSQQAYQSSRLLGKRSSEEAYGSVPEQSTGSQISSVQNKNDPKRSGRSSMSSRQTREEEGQYMLELGLPEKGKIEGPSGNNLDSWALQRVTAERLVLNDLLSPGGPRIPTPEYNLSGKPIEASLLMQYTNLPYDSRDSPLPITMTKSPSIEYSKKIWWDRILSHYGQNRTEAHAAIIKEIKTLFRISNHWIAFFNIPKFLAILHNPDQRQNLQPSLIYAMLALATQLTSWDGPGGQGFKGRLLSLKLNEHAHASFWQSWNSGFINVDLAKAAFLMSLYETSSHPLYLESRIAQSLVLLDAVIRILNLTSMDADNPRTSRFEPDEIPRVPADAKRVSLSDYDGLCLHAEQSVENCTFWAACPRWNKPGLIHIDEIEIEKEEARRLCWSSSALAASSSTYTHNVWGMYSSLSITNPANYALLFPGELLTDEEERIGKSSMWALYYTSGLLWHFSIRLHNDSSVSPKEKQKTFAKIWEITEEIESYFGAIMSDDLFYEGQTWHARVGSLAYVWQSRDWLATSRFLIYDALVKTMAPSERVPRFPVDAARLWLKNQATVAKAICPGGASSIKLARFSIIMVNHRPFWIWWLIQQLSRMMIMYERDTSLIDILDVARDNFAPILDYLAHLYPSKCLAQTLSSQIFSRLNSFNERASHSYAVAFPASTALGPRFPLLSVPLSGISINGGVEELVAAFSLPSEDVKS